MNHSGLIDAKFDLAGFGFADGGRDIQRHSSGLWVGHQASRAQNLSERADRAHHIRRRDQRVEFEVAALDLVDQIFSPDLVSAGLLGLALFFGLAGDDDHAFRFAQTVRKNDRSAHQLIGFARIDAEHHRDLDRLIELRRTNLLGV